MSEESKEARAQKAARARLRRGDAKLTDKIKKDIAIAYKPIEEWDWEELSKGKPRNKNGTFIGTRPGTLTPAIEDERRRRITHFTMTEIAAQARDALATIHELMTDRGVDDEGRPTTPAKVRLDAATYYLDQFIGKARTSVEFSNSDPLYELMTGILVNRDGSPAHPDYQVIEGTTVEDDLSDDDEDDAGPLLMRHRDDEDDE